jgi:hypothetical protein
MVRPPNHPVNQPKRAAPSHDESEYGRIDCHNGNSNATLNVQRDAQTEQRNQHPMKQDGTLENHRIYSMSVARVYPEYVAKAERKGRTRAEVDEIIRWLTGYSQEGLEKVLADGTDFQTFFGEAPALNPARASIKGVICGVRVEEIPHPLMQNLRYLDKLIDELAKGKPMEKILRS